MTREEAREILEKLIPQPQRGDGKSITHLMITEALTMAIKALEQEPCECKQVDIDRFKEILKNNPPIISVLEQEPCEDYISKAALLAKIDEERKHLLDLKMDGAEHIIVHHARRIIEDMPTVTPKAGSED